MSFEFGDILTRAWKITWNHKVLWAISVLPFFSALLILPLWLGLAFQKNVDFNRLAIWMQNPTYMSIAILVYLVFIAASILLQIASRSSLTLGIYRAEAAIRPITFVDLVRNGLQYFWRILGASFLIGVGMFAIFIAFFVITGLLSAVTLGLAALCLQPLFILLIPVFLLVATLMEQAESAIIADQMNVVDALRQAYELIRSNIWKYVLITLIVYFGMNILMSLITFPLMIPMFFFLARNIEAGLDFHSMIRMQAVFGVAILPILALVQGFSLTYRKSAMMLTYLRLTRPSQWQPLPGIVEATS